MFFVNLIQSHTYTQQIQGTRKRVDRVKQQEQVAFFCQKSQIEFHTTAILKEIQGLQHVPGNLLKLIAPFPRTKTP